MSTNPAVVLLVEDNLDHAELIRRSFGHDTGCALYHVCDGQEALEYLDHRGSYADEAASPRPQLVLLDLRLPRLDGLEVLRTVRDNPALRRIPVVMLTTSDATADIAQAYDLCANSYVVKPIDFQQFASTMQNLRTYWLGYNAYASA